jgi:hypothetical protein
MKKLFIVLLFVCIPAASLACSPPIPMAGDDLEKWTEANPCPEENDVAKYNMLRRQCIEAEASKIGMTYDDFIEVPPPGTKVFSECNHSAFASSVLPPQPAPAAKQ